MLLIRITEKKSSGNHVDKRENVNNRRELCMLAPFIEDVRSRDCTLAPKLALIPFVYNEQKGTLVLIVVLQL